jgi:AcrR family transcriptional regulator
MSAAKTKSPNGTANRIVEAAVQLFSRQGFAASSTHEIARLAGVSEVTVFRHFPRKRDLFWAATESRLCRLRISKELRGRLDADESPRTALPGVVALLVETFHNQPEMVRLLYLSLFELEHGAERILRKYLVPFFHPIREYLARCASNGLARNLDPSIAALALMTSIVAHHGLYRVVTDEATGYPGTDEATAAYAEFWFKALMFESLLPSPTNPDECLGAPQANPQEQWIRTRAAKQSTDLIYSPTQALGTE